MAKILVVDDRPENRQFLVTLLGYRSHQLLEAADGSEALALARAEHPDLVITDILMPTMDGYEFVRQLRADAAIGDTTIIFCTAHFLGREAENLARSCGVSHLLVKPCEPEIVLRVVQEALGLAPASAPTPLEHEFDRQHLRLLTDKLSEQTAQLRGANHRLAELIDVNLRLAAENDTLRMLQGLCGAARSLTGAKYAAVGVSGKTDSGVPDYFVTSGMDAEMADGLGVPGLRQGVLAALLTERRPLRLKGLQGDPQAVGFSSRHPPVHCLLGTPITTLARTYGWLCLTDKLGGEEFSQEDEHLTLILAEQVGRIYENRNLYADVQGQARMLEQEVAERRNAERELRKLNDELDLRVKERTAELESANQELEAFSYSVSHDLRAPLRAIDGFAAFLTEDYLAQLPAAAKGYLLRIREGAQRMGKLIDDLLAFARVSRRPLRQELIDPSYIVHQVLEELQRDHEDRRIEVRLGALPECTADPALLKQVWTNLISNAFKFTRGREPAVVEVGSISPSGELVYFVKDNGAGFDMRYADRLFGVFHRLHRDEEFEGTGVGLSLVQRIVHRHGGRIWAEAKVDQGAAFYFTLPNIPAPSSGHDPRAAVHTVTQRRDP
jgi:signal transduction histidine kinase/CheY-like chemotaxis protein